MNLAGYQLNRPVNRSEPIARRLLNSNLNLTGSDRLPAKPDRYTGTGLFRFGRTGREGEPWSYNGGAAVGMTWGNEPTPSPHEATPVRVAIFWGLLYILWKVDKPSIFKADLAQLPSANMFNILIG